ncbi:hypothetical protein RUM43_001361 [Polyplax serrata]|uniref:Death domain-containing protein n=1 Tax=Polyplax serrata TaxID=468196 RepID=A0AAN8XQI9_POLSC
MKPICVELFSGGTSRAQWEDVTGSTPLTFVNDCVSFTTTVSARFWLMDCRNVGEATKMATELYREAIHVPFMAKFVVFAKRVDTMEARLRVFCMTDDKEDKTLEHQEHFTEVAKSRDVEVLEGKQQYVELAGNLVPVTKSGDQLQLGFKAFRENRLPFTVRVKDPHVDSIGRLLFMKEAKVSKGDPPQQPMCCLNIVLPETIMPDSSLSEPDLYALQKKISAMKDSGIEIRRNDLRLSDISNLLGYDWIVLAPHLDIDDSDINLIKMENPGNEAQQARAMLRLWLYLKGYKASSKSLEKALHRINRDDVSEQCIQTQKLKSKYTTQKDENTNQRILFSDDSDIIKDADSIEYILHKTSGGRIKTDETDEKKYLAEEKDVPEEKKTVKERKQEIEKRLSQERQLYDYPKPTEMLPTDTKTTKSVPKAHTAINDFIQGEVQYPSPVTKTQSEPFERQITVKEKVMQFQDKEKGGGGDPAQRDSTTKVIKTTENIIISQKEDFTRTSGRKQPTEQAEEELRRITDENRRRDSQLLENVTEGLGKISRKDDTQKDFMSSKPSKTPPPSPADFFTKGKQALSAKLFGCPSSAVSDR